MRPDWDIYFAQITRLITSRSTCLRAQHGAVLVRDKRILATGYNGVPSGTIHCSDLGECYRQKNNIPSGTQYEKCKSLHAEQNVLMQCAQYGIPSSGAILYVTDVPCEICAKLLIAAKISEVVILKNSGRYSSEALNNLRMELSIRYLEE